MTYGLLPGDTLSLTSKWILVLASIVAAGATSVAWACSYLDTQSVYDVLGIAPLRAHANEEVRLPRNVAFVFFARDPSEAEIDRQLRAHERVSLFADISGLDGLTLAALGRDFRYSVGKLGELHRRDRVAVVSEKPWLRAWSGLATTRLCVNQCSVVRSTNEVLHEGALACDDVPRRAC